MGFFVQMEDWPCERRRKRLGAFGRRSGYERRIEHVPRPPLFRSTAYRHGLRSMPRSLAFRRRSAEFPETSKISCSECAWFASLSSTDFDPHHRGKKNEHALPKCPYRVSESPVLDANEGRVRRNHGYFAWATAMPRKRDGKGRGNKDRRRGCKIRRRSTPSFD